MLTSARPLWWWTLLAVAVVSWVALLLLDVLQHQGIPLFAGPLFDVDTDRGAAECTSYVFLLVSVVSLLLTWRAGPRRSVLCVLAVFLLVYLADDMLGFHESVGAVLGERAGLGPIVGIGPPTLGSWAMWGLVVGPFVLLFALTWARSRTCARHGALRILRWLAVLLFFAVVVDALRPITGAYGLKLPDGVAYALKLIEFSGEFAAYVGLCTVAVRMVLDVASFPREAASREPGTITGSAAGTRSRRSPVTMPTDSPSR